MSLLSGYRALDLSEGGTMIGGQMLGDIGVDIIKVEPPGGSPSRNHGPFYKDRPDPRCSLFWFAYNAGKKSITLNLQTADGQAIFKKLNRNVDFVIESFSPGYLDGLGLDYDTLSQINPRLILTSITWFGRSGPKAGYKGSDLIAWAAGGELLLSGEADRAPNWLSFPQASLHGGAYAASATMVAHWYREQSGDGQLVDVSIQEIVPYLPEAFIVPAWDLIQYEYKRSGMHYTTSTGVDLACTFACQDGYVSMYVLAGDVTMLDSSKALQTWIVEEGKAPDWFKTFNWEAEYDASKVTQETADRIEGVVTDFVKTKTKAEIYEAAMTRRILAAPVSTAKDVSEDHHLEARDFWLTVNHPELQDAITYARYPIKPTDPAAFKDRGRAPLIGEHNAEIYTNGLGLSKDDLVMLKQAGVI